jgi:hypothetical protein
MAKEELRQSEGAVSSASLTAPFDFPVPRIGFQAYQFSGWNCPAALGRSPPRAHAVSRRGHLLFVPRAHNFFSFTYRNARLSRMASARIFFSSVFSFPAP